MAEVFADLNTRDERGLYVTMSTDSTLSVGDHIRVRDDESTFLGQIKEIRERIWPARLIFFSLE